MYGFMVWRLSHSREIYSIWHYTVCFGAVPEERGSLWKDTANCWLQKCGPRTHCQNDWKRVLSLVMGQKGRLSSIPRMALLQCHNSKNLLQQNHITRMQHEMTHMIRTLLTLDSNKKEKTAEVHHQKHHWCYSLFNSSERTRLACLLLFTPSCKGLLALLELLMRWNLKKGH